MIMIFPVQCDGNNAKAVNSRKVLGSIYSKENATLMEGGGFVHALFCACVVFGLGDGTPTLFPTPSVFASLVMVGDLCRSLGVSSIVVQVLLCGKNLQTMMKMI